LPHGFGRPQIEQGPLQRQSLLVEHLVTLFREFLPQVREVLVQVFQGVFTASAVTPKIERFVVIDPEPIVAFYSHFHRLAQGVANAVVLKVSHADGVDADRFVSGHVRCSSESDGPRVLNRHSAYRQWQFEPKLFRPHLPLP
jgi:hypothetical protein